MADSILAQLQGDAHNTSSELDDRKYAEMLQHELKYVRHTAHTQAMLMGIAGHERRLRAGSAC